jgi:hypothetical protein
VSTPLPHHLAALEQALVESRAELPEALRGRVLAAASAASPVAVPATRWFVAAIALAAAVALNFSNSAALAPAQELSPSVARCGLRSLFGAAPASCFESKE